MMVRRTINGMQPRTTRDAARDPFDWWESREPTHILGGSWPGVFSRPPTKVQRIRRCLVRIWRFLAWGR